MSGRPIGVGPIGATVARQVVGLRAYHAMTQEDLAARLTVELGRDVTLPTVRAMEHAVRRVDVDELAALSRIFGVRADKFLKPWSIR